MTTYPPPIVGRTGDNQAHPVFLAASDMEVGSSNPLPVGLGDSASVDAFARLRVSEPTTLFDSSSIYQNSPLIWQTKTAGSGSSSFVANDSSVDLTVTSAAGDSVIRQTRQYYPYQPGKSQLVFMTFNLGETGGISFVLRSKTSGTVVDTVFERADWNVDTFDGNGLSGKTADMTKAHIFWADLEWLGVGRVRMGLVIDGTPLLGHVINNAGAKSTTYMKRAFLPCRYEITNDATHTTKLAGYGDADDGVFIRAKNAKGAATLKTICCAIMSEGGYSDVLGVPFGVANGTTTIGVTTRRAVISIRPKLTFNSLVGRALVAVESINIYAQTNPCYFEVVYGATLGGSPSWNSTNGQSMVEFDVAGTTVTGGVTISSGYASAGGTGSNAFSTSQQRSLQARLPIALDIDGAHPTTPYTDSISVVVTSMSGTSNVASNISWREIR